MRTFQAWSVMMIVMVSASFGQTASDLGEGLRAELTATSGVTAIKWWGKAGRTYFVQSSETLLPDSWQYMPVVEAGGEAVISWNLQTNASKMFVRLVYTEQLYTGAAGDADFDGDGLTNAQETAASGPHSSPLAADTDGDGFSDSVEWGAGYSPLNSLYAPSTSVMLQACVGESWNLAIWTKDTGQPAKYSLLKDTETPQWPDSVSGWSTTAPTVPMPASVRGPGNVNYGGWGSLPLWNGESYDSVVASSYDVSRHIDPLAAPADEYNGGRDLKVRYGQLRLVANYPSLYERSRVVKLNIQKWNASMGVYGGWQGPQAGEEAPQYYQLFLPAGMTVGTAQVVQLAPQPGKARFGTAELVPTMEIKRDIAGGIIQWESIAGKAAQAIVGQQIKLKLELPTGFTGTDFNWGISGPKFKDYPEPTETSAHVVPLEAADFTSQEMSFRWIQPGQHNVSANCLISGVRVHVSQQFEVFAPTCTLKGTQEAFRAGPGYGYGGGASWSATTGLLPPSFPEGGRWMFVQTVRVNHLQVPDAGPPNKINQFNGEWCLDTLPGVGVSYAATGKRNAGESNSTQDSPFGNAYDAGAEQKDEQWNTYVMFKSKEAEACWVPLKVMSWERGYKSAHAPFTGIYFFDTYPQQPLNLTGVETRYHPEWSHMTSFEVISQP